MKELGELVADVKAATEDYESARTAESMAGSRRCEALNRLNAAQKALDAVLKGMRDKAPYDSDWKADERHSRSVRVA